MLNTKLPQSQIRRGRDSHETQHAQQQQQRQYASGLQSFEYSTREQDKKDSRNNYASFNNQFRGMQTRDIQVMQEDYGGLETDKEEECSEGKQSYTPSDMLSNIFDSRKSNCEQEIFFDNTPKNINKLNEGSIERIDSCDQQLFNDIKQIESKQISDNMRIQINYNSIEDDDQGDNQCGLVVEEEYDEEDEEEQPNEPPVVANSKFQKGKEDPILQDIAESIQRNQDFLNTSSDKFMKQANLNQKRLHLYENILSEDERGDTQKTPSQSSNYNLYQNRPNQSPSLSHPLPAQIQLDNLNVYDINTYQPLSSTKMSTIKKTAEKEFRSSNDKKEYSSAKNNQINESSSSKQKQTEDHHQAQQKSLLEKQLCDLQQEDRMLREQIEKADSEVNKLEIKRKKLKNKHKELGLNPQYIQEKESTLSHLRSKVEMNDFIIQELIACNNQIADQLQLVEMNILSQKQHQIDSRVSKQNKKPNYNDQSNRLSNFIKEHSSQAAAATNLQYNQNGSIGKRNIQTKNNNINNVYSNK